MQLLLICSCLMLLNVPMRLDEDEARLLVEQRLSREESVELWLQSCDSAVFWPTYSFRHRHFSHVPASWLRRSTMNVQSVSAAFYLAPNLKEVTDGRVLASLTFGLVFQLKNWSENRRVDVFFNRCQRVIECITKEWGNQVFLENSGSVCVCVCVCVCPCCSHECEGLCVLRTSLCDAVTDTNEHQQLNEIIYVLSFKLTDSRPTPTERVTGQLTCLCWCQWWKVTKYFYSYTLLIGYRLSVVNLNIYIFVSLMESCPVR